MRRGPDRSGALPGARRRGLPSSLRRGAAGAFAVAAALGSAGAARACPGADAPCAVAGGAYLALAPAGPSRGLFLFLHGWGGVPADVAGDAALTGPALARGYVVVAPAAAPRPEGGGGSWNAEGAPGRRDDVAFLRAVLADAAARFGADGSAALAAGFSEGGMMVWRLACEAPGSAAAFAPVAGLLWAPLPRRCAGPARLLHTHGWADGVVPLEGRAVAGGRLVQGDLADGLRLLRRSFGCADDAPDAFDAVGPFLRRFWTDCAPGAALGVALHPGGHGAPEGWTDMALDWFEAG